ncbi:MAG TPA: hypothetical protein VH253_03090 [Phycisphaerae bacterium]|nr:hypothetical protein [Phycisphaerae bacterium]
MRPLAVLLLIPVLLSACTETRVIYDDSPGARLAQFQKNGWAVSSAQKKAAPQTNQPPAGAFMSGKDFLGDVHWTTNLPADQVEGGNATSVPGYGGLGEPLPAPPGGGAAPSINGGGNPLFPASGGGNPVASPASPGMMAPSGSAPAAGSSSPGSRSTSPPAR